MQTQSPDTKTNPRITEVQSTIHADLCALPRLMNQRDLADYLKKSTAWCERARWAGEGPRFVKLGRHVRYRAEDVLAWIDANARTCSSDAEG